MNSTVEVFIDGGSIGTVVAAEGTFSFDHSETSLATGTYALTAKATDAAGNTSAESAAFTLEVDITAPDAPEVTGISVDSAVTDGITNDQGLVINGSAEVNSTVEVFIDGGSIGTVVAADGTFSWIAR